MDILLQAVQAVQKNVSALGLYLLCTVPASALVLAGNVWMGMEGDSGAAVSGTLVAYQAGSDAFLIAAYALAQSLAFSRMGRQIDRPIWKCPGDREAIRRYFPLWIILNIVAVGSQRLVVWLPALMDDESAAMPVFWLMAIVMAVYLPVGAAVMFAGKPDWRQLGEALAPLGRQWTKTLSICFFSGVIYFLLVILILQNQSQNWIHPVIDVISGYFDCVIFCATWLLCMLDRQMPQEDDLDYF
ncbi:MAG TPA: hypothetical protein PKO36_06340 [Candidatus Hydrogenedentes bacterium]|nr:hypothetical protein [Candidatus Hydrogenedentota bacterium]HOT50649.1 hypothetical protein [Candidatus Hydrogenedentota bacterium]HOV75517.1 hypothetical protein [Candidatus Hydrogenedentota bacterium]HPC18161.1 hypothetical protein [Candidatus Hydrogenedentota bacterium]HRT20374.1 hypothetical protein [Candidatus Hydrogenedentota bacterium]